MIELSQEGSLQTGVGGDVFNKRPGDCGALFTPPSLMRACTKEGNRAGDDGYLSRVLMSATGAWIASGRHRAKPTEARCRPTNTTRQQVSVAPAAAEVCLFFCVPEASSDFNEGKQQAMPLCREGVLAAPKSQGGELALPRSNLFIPFSFEFAQLPLILGIRDPTFSLGRRFRLRHRALSRSFVGISH
jgi:hypothetical protein